MKERRERLRKAQSLLDSEGWSFLREEIEKEKNYQLENLLSCQRDGMADKAKFIAGIIEGINIVLNRPVFITTRSLGVLDKLCDLMGVK